MRMYGLCVCLSVRLDVSLHSNSAVDINVKSRLVRDVLNLAGFILPNREDVVPGPQPPTDWRSGATFAKLLRKILGRFIILGKSLENIWQSTNIKLGNNNAILINTYFCIMLDVIRGVVVKS